MRAALQLADDMLARGGSSPPRSKRPVTGARSEQRKGFLRCARLFTRRSYLRAAGVFRQTGAFRQVQACSAGHPRREMRHGGTAAAFTCPRWVIRPCGGEVAPMSAWSHAPTLAGSRRRPLRTPVSVARRSRFERRENGAIGALIARTGLDKRGQGIAHLDEVSQLGLQTGKMFAGHGLDLGTGPAFVLI